MSNYSLKIESSWKEILKDELNKDYFKNILNFLKKELNNWKTIFPQVNNIFDALNKTPFDNVKVVIIWQDPYHWAWQAHWLCFSVPEWITPPPSLKNIFKEINSDLNINIKTNNWNLEKWTKQGVLLLNAILSVEEWKAASHSKIWWEKFTNNIIKTISDKKEWIIFLLWGWFARSKKSLINTKKHYILEAVHPSPLSAYNWFFWCKHFSKTNEILKKIWKDEIDWNL